MTTAPTTVSTGHVIGSNNSNCMMLDLPLRDSVPERVCVAGETDRTTNVPNIATRSHVTVNPQNQRAPGRTGLAP
jgi:hypothetical protein